MFSDDGWLLQLQNETTSAHLQQEIEQRDDLLQRLVQAVFNLAGCMARVRLGDELRTYSGDRFKLALKTFIFATY